MKFELITDKKIWDDFFNAVRSPSFHQSWEWGEMQKKLGYEILRLGLFVNNKIELISLIVKVRSKRGSFIFLPHGPIFNLPSISLSQSIPQLQSKQYMAYLQELKNFLIDIAKKEGFWFIRIAPSLIRTQHHEEIFRSLGFRKAPTYMHAETMWVVDVTLPEETLLNNMRKNTRYSIRRAIREKIGVAKYTDSFALEKFVALYELTSKREKFKPYSKSYLQSEFEVFNEHNNAIFFLGGLPNNLNNSTPLKFDQEAPLQIIAGSLVVYTKSCGFYHQGASIHTQFPASYLLQWHSILETKKRGCKFYSFHGISDPGRTPKSWDGLTLFKRGFGGFQMDYLYTQDYIVSPLYYFSAAIDTYLNLKRGI